MYLHKPQTQTLNPKLCLSSDSFAADESDGNRPFWSCRSIQALGLGANRGLGFRVYFAKMEKKWKLSGVYRGYLGIMEKNMETARATWGLSKG